MGEAQQASATFRPGPMKNRESWALDGNMVSGEGKAIDLATVNRVYFSDTPTSNRQQYSLRLKLMSSDDSLTIACLAKTNDAGRASCKRLHAAIVRHLHEVNPDATVHVEGGPLKQTLTFVMFLVLSLGLLAIAIVSFGQGAAIPAIICVVLGVALGAFAVRFLPWPSSKFERSPIEAADHIAGTRP